MKAYVFPGQGAQFSGMGKDLYESSESAKLLFEQANQILGFEITKTMFDGTDEELKQTNITQPAVFLHSVILAKSIPDFNPDMVAGHSLGEFSSLVSNGALSFEDGLQLVAQRAKAMQKACEKTSGKMAAILGLADDQVELICEEIDEIVIPANYNCPGQLVISGSSKGIELACAKALESGAKRALPLPVSGAFHSPLMESAREELASAIENTIFEKPVCPVYQNVDSLPHTDPQEIKENLVKQLTGAVRWTQSVQNMTSDGATQFVECGPGKVLQGLVKKINRGMDVSAAQLS